MKRTGISRRTFFRHACGGTLGLAGSLGLLPVFAAQGTKTTLTPDEALALLKEGNAKFLADKPTISPQDHERRLEIARAQTPFAVLVSCSDSRVPPELLFDRGLGELFIVRNAGNRADHPSRAEGQERRQAGGRRAARRRRAGKRSPGSRAPAQLGAGASRTAACR
jgi:carbonic anhydrase